MPEPGWAARGPAVERFVRSMVESVIVKHSKVHIPWKEGLHLRPAAKLVKCARIFQSSISLKVNDRLADARSILAVMLLCATFGAVVDLEASGTDEAEALAAVTAVFEPVEPDASKEPAEGGLKPAIF